MSEQERQAIVDDEHLRVLSICHLVFAGINVLFSLFGLFYAAMGVFFTAAISRMPPQPGQSAPPEFIGLFFGLIGLAMFAFMAGLGALQFLVAKRLKQRRSRMLCIFVAAVICILMPYGTALGVFTIVVLSRQSIARSFDVHTAAANAR